MRDLRIVGDGKRALLQIDALTVEAGACVGIRGPSGAGKSTLLFAIAGLLAIQRGSVRWGDTDIAALGEGRRTAFRRRSIGLIFQDYLLFEELSAAANAGIAGGYSAGERAAIDRRAEDVLRRMGVPTSGRSVASFSGGERQRVAVARALATDPAVILADEPTASLDRPAADRLVDDLVQLARGFAKTLIVVSHDPAVHGRVDRLIEVVDGRLTGDIHA